MLLAREFPSAEDYVMVMNGCDVCGHSFMANGFRKPVLVRSKDGLRIKVPVESFTPRDLTKFIDPVTVVDVIDVRQQTEIQMPLRDLVDQFCSDTRPMLLNMLSLEFSRTSLAKFVRPPHVVSELSLVTTCWPDDDVDESELSDEVAPTVQKYCLLSMEGSYTDFHIDFGGSSVWYHVMWGEKVFYLMPPTPEYLSAYWQWCMSDNHRTIFFPDFVADLLKKGSCDTGEPTVYCLHVSPGQTIFLPAGWIHAVYTPSDCLVFGGNFLNGLHVPTQLRVYRMEQKCETPMKFLFPNFEKVHWFYSQRLLDKLTNSLTNGENPVTHDLDAAESLVKVLPVWYAKRRSLPPEERRYFLPSQNQLDIPCAKLIERLNEVLSSISPRSVKHSGFSAHSFQSGIYSKHSKSNVQLTAELSPVDSMKCLNSDLSMKIKWTTKDKHVGGLGWIPNRHTQGKSLSESKHSVGDKEEEEEEGEHIITDDDEILKALPGLKKSRLIGDHYYLTLSDSEDDDDNTVGQRKEGYSSQSKSTSYQVGKKRKTRDDDDPTWSMPSPTRRRCGTSIWKSKDSGPIFPNLKTGKTSLHPLLSEAGASSSSSSTLKRAGGASASPASGATGVKKSRAKQTTTVRQRLAKRLGI
ncbi:unnamed protein product [Trichobilharzia szidati]|nr:unnamed protein product [Trichobilharzia szidati]